MSFCYKIGDQKGKIGPVWKIVTMEAGKAIRKMYRRVTIMEILYTQACKWKNGTDETISEMWGG
jgi:hypothetical protein